MNYTEDDIKRETDSQQYKAVIDYFNYKRNGFFIELGAADGILCSNTYRLEKDYGWNGILIEPIKDYFDTMCLMRTASHKYNVCIDSEKDFVDFKRVEGYSKMLSGMIKECPILHNDRIEKEVKERNQTVIVEKIQCKTLENIIVECGMPAIDYLAVDVEGGELSVMKSLKMETNNIRPTIISSENNYNEDRVQKYLNQFGYKKVAKICLDDFYIIP